MKKLVWSQMGKQKGEKIIESQVFKFNYKCLKHFETLKIIMFIKSFFMLSQADFKSFPLNFMSKHV